MLAVCFQSGERLCHVCPERLSEIGGAQQGGMRALPLEKDPMHSGRPGCHRHPDCKERPSERIIPAFQVSTQSQGAPCTQEIWPQTSFSGLKQKSIQER